MIDYCRLAREALTHWLTHERMLDATVPVGRRAGCFVSLHDSEGHLRGCIGTIRAVYDDLSQEIVENAVSAGTRDPRFPAVTAGELADLSIDVSILGEDRPVADPSTLDPLRDGVIVSAGSRKGLLLPDLPGIDQVSQQIAIAKRKAGIPADAAFSLRSFQVEKHDERR